MHAYAYVLHCKYMHRISMHVYDSIHHYAMLCCETFAYFERDASAEMFGVATSIGKSIPTRGVHPPLPPAG